MVCGLCEKIINYKHVAGSEFDDNIIFDCLETSEFNHVFHHKCLKKVIGAEHTNKKAMQGLELNKFYRCPKCYPQSRDVIISYSEMAKKVKPQREDSNSDSESSQLSHKSDVEEVVKAVVVPNNDEAKRFAQQEKQLRRFDELMAKEFTLSKSDFIL